MTLSMHYNISPHIRHKTYHQKYLLFLLILIVNKINKQINSTVKKQENNKTSRKQIFNMKIILFKTQPQIQTVSQFHEQPMKKKLVDYL
jgi:hypothetical protein